MYINDFNLYKDTCISYIFPVDVWGVAKGKSVDSAQI